jgi:hypothetical protein
MAEVIDHQVLGLPTVEALLDIYVTIDVYDFNDLIRLS